MLVGGSLTPDQLGVQGEDTLNQRIIIYAYLNIIDFFSHICFWFDFKSPFSKGGFFKFQMRMHSYESPLPPFSKGGM